MPYVEVWVDNECDGDCCDAVERKRLEARIDEAERHLRSGDAEAALHALTDDPAIPMKRPEEIASRYEAWKAGRLPGFIPRVSAPTEAGQ